MLLYLRTVHDFEASAGVSQLRPARTMKPTVVYCAGGYRSSIAASLLREAGFADVSDVLGGYAAIAA